MSTYVRKSIETRGEASMRSPSLARLLQFGDSAFPVGSFSFSMGLESAVQQKVVTDAATLRTFVTTATQQAMIGDGIGLIHAHRVIVKRDLDAAIKIDHTLFNRKVSESMREMSLKMGKKFSQLAATVVKEPLLDRWLLAIQSGDARGTYPVSLATAFAVLGLDSRMAFVTHQNGVATAILNAALRLLRISHRETHALLFDVNATFDKAYEEAACACLEDMSGFAPLTEILSAVHTRAYVRLFMN